MYSEGDLEIDQSCKGYVVACVTAHVCYLILYLMVFLYEYALVKNQ